MTGAPGFRCFYCGEPTTDRATVVDVIVRDCGYGFAAHAVMSDGSRVHGGLCASPMLADMALQEALHGVTQPDEAT